MLSGGDEVELLPFDIITDFIMIMILASDVGELSTCCTHYVLRFLFGALLGVCVILLYARPYTCLILA